MGARRRSSPDTLSPRVDRHVSPEPSSPDLPIRGSPKLTECFSKETVLNQGVHKTCVAHATFAALNILARKIVWSKSESRKNLVRHGYIGHDRDGLG